MKTLDGFVLGLGFLVSGLIVRWVVHCEQIVPYVFPCAVLFGSTLGVVCTGPLVLFIERRLCGHDGMIIEERIWMMLGLLWIVALAECVLFPREFVDMMPGCPGLIANLLILGSGWTIVPLVLWNVALSSWWSSPKCAPNWKQKAARIVLYYYCAASLMVLATFTGLLWLFLELINATHVFHVISRLQACAR